jgi:protein-disulfide isomerase
LARALDRFDGQVQLVLYHFVLNDISQIATEAALCAGEQGQFWPFHDMLYARQAQWRSLSNPLPRLLELAASSGLDVNPDTLRQCVNSGRMQGRIAADQKLGRSLQVRSTPTVFINNKRIVGAQAAGDYIRVIQQELTRAQSQTS